MSMGFTAWPDRVLLQGAMCIHQGSIGIKLEKHKPHDEEILQPFPGKKRHKQQKTT